MRSSQITETLDRALMVLTVFEELRAALLFGSQSDGTADSFSDVDVLVIASKAVPSGEERLRQYRAAGLGEALSFDTELGSFRRDVVSMQDAMLDLHWIGMPAAERCIHDLSRDYDSDESLPAILLEARPLYDPHDTLGRLKRDLPEYPPERAAHRHQRALRAARREFEVLRRLEAAVLRADAFSFSQARQEMLDLLLQDLFAVNHTWFRSRPRMLKRVAALPNLPKDAMDRITLALESPDLAAAYDALQGLF